MPESENREMSRRVVSKSPRKNGTKSLQSIKSASNLISPSTSTQSNALAYTTQRISETVSSNPQFEEQERRFYALSSEIRSKERTLELLTVRFPTESEPLLTQLQERDKQIEEIETQLRETSAKLAIAGIESVSAKDKQIALLQEDKIRLFRDLQKSDEEIATLQRDLKERESALQEERENIELVEEALTEENAALKTEGTRKNDQIKAIRGDILQLSKIVGEMSKLNTDLNEKILLLNGQMENANARTYEHQARAKQTDDIEQAYNQLRTEYLAVQKRERKLVEELARLSDLNTTSFRCQDRLKTLEESLPPESREIYTEIQEIRYELKLQTVVKEEKKDQIYTLKQQLSEMAEAYNDKSLELKKTQITYESTLKRVEFFEAEKQKIREQYEESLERLGLRGQITADIYEKLREKVEFFSDELTKADANLQKSMTKVVSLQGQLDRLREEKRANSRSEEGKIKQIHELKAELLTLRSQKVAQETVIATRENRLRVTAAEMKSLIDEIWKKDTEILKLKKMLSKHTQNTEETRNRADIRMQAAAQLATNSEEMERKDLELELFRGMLRSTQLQLRTKEAEVQRLKRKYENDPVREGKPVAFAARDLSLEKLAEKLDSEVRKVEDLVEIRRQLQEDCPLPPDTLRRKLAIEEVPRDKVKVVGMITAKVNDIYETLAKWTNVKFKEGLQRSLLPDQVTSSLLSSLLQTTPTIEISVILDRLQELIHTSFLSKPRRKAA